MKNIYFLIPLFCFLGLYNIYNLLGSMSLFILLSLIASTTKQRA